MAARNGTGSFVRSYDWTDDAANSIPITASRFDEEMDGIAAEITNSLALDGQSTMAGILKMGGYKIQNVAAAAALTDAPNATQISNNSFGYLGTTGGTSAAYTLTPSPAITAYTTGQEFSFTTNANNTLSSSETTLAISGLAATNLRKLNSAGSKVAVAADDLVSGISYKVRYDGTHFLLIDNSLQDAATAATETAAGIVELATNAEFTTGTDTARAITAANVLAGLGFTELATSSEISLTAGGDGNFAHGLGVMPKIVTASLRCKTAQVNWAVDDELYCGGFGFFLNNSPTGVLLGANSTNVKYVFGSDATIANIIDATSGAGANVTAASWRLVIRAWG